MIRQICNIKSEDVSTVRELLAKLKLEDLDLILREKRPADLYGYVEHSSGAVRTACACALQVVGMHRPGRPKVTWNLLTENDCLSRLSVDQVPDLLCQQQTGTTEVDDATAPVH